MCFPNEQVVHGIPNDIPLESGTILSLDCGVEKMVFLETLPSLMKLEKFLRMS
ncbi:MAG: hypothetical protein CM15mP23_13860 [Cryomorphaceae bacterium]|nr:MAG: hypothetical protein CM15mP23_13860 [Cryomorphaceae bacterium]